MDSEISKREGSSPLRAQVDALLTHFGNVLGIPDLALDADHSCQLQFDNTVISIVWDETSERMMIYSVLGEVPEDRLGHVSRELLAANFLFARTRGTTLGIEQRSRQVALCSSLRPGGLLDSEFCAEIEGFLHIAEEWAAKCQVLAAEPLLVESTKSSGSFPITFA